ncbi:MAG: O-Antigen ligase [Microgenomates bacterium OLB23]|nr:MAG: O-Antigen ligase [Microgenomates bacterium OLB23]
MIQIFLLLAYWIGNIVRLPVTQDVTLLALDVLVAVVFVMHLPYFYTNRYMLMKQNLVKATVFLVVALALSLVFAVPRYALAHILQASMYLIRFVCYVSLLFIPLRLSHSFIKLLVAGFVTLGFAQYVLYPNLRYLLYLGWDDHYLRLFGSLFDPNFMGIMLVLMISTLLWRVDGKKSNHQDYLLASIAFFALLLTFSRSAFVVGFLTWVTTAALQRNAKLIIAIVLFFMCGVYLLPKNLPSEGGNLLRTKSISARSQEFAKAAAIIKTNPLFGVGFNTYRYARAQYFSTPPSGFPEHSAAGVPNSYLLIFATAGICGLSLFIVWLGLLWQSYAKLVSLAIPLLITYMLSGFFDNTMLYPFVMCWVFLMLKQTELSQKVETNHNRNHKVR